MFDREKKFVSEEKKDIKNILMRFKKRDFSGNTGIAIKNSSYQFATTAIAKIGSLVFTIIIAKLLLPELFGLYSLALGTIILFSSFSELGIAPSLIKFVSIALAHNEESKAKSYFKHFLKFKSLLVVLSSVALLILANFLANVYYDKPIYFALLAGALYIFSIGFIGFFDSLLHSLNRFKPSLIKEILFQILRFSIVPLIILHSMKSGLSSEKIIFVIILSLSFIYLIVLLFIFLASLRNAPFLRRPSRRLNIQDKKVANRFMFILSTTFLSGIFLGYIDMFMLGHFVESEFIGFYQAAFSLVGALIPLIPFSIVLLPIFSRMKGKQLENGMKKSLGISMVFSFFVAIATFIVAPLAIRIIYTPEFSPATWILRILSILVFVTPITALYTDYFFARNKPGVIAKNLIFTTILNIILNYFLITSLLKYSPFMASVGAAIATILSKSVYFVMLFFSWRKATKLAQ